MVCLLLLLCGAMTAFIGPVAASGGPPPRPPSSSASSSSQATSASASATATVSPSPGSGASSGVGARVGCNGVQEVCNLPLSRITFVGAHNAATSSLSCVVTTSGVGNNSCGIGAKFVDSAYECQSSNFSELLEMGVRWLDIAFVGLNPADKSQAYSAHNSVNRNFGIAYGPSAVAVFDTIGTFLSNNPNELVVLWLKKAERDAAIMASEGPNGYTAFYNSLKASPAAPFLAGQIDIANEPLGQLIQQGKRLVVMGWDDLPEDIGVRDVSWLTDSWNNPQNVADLQKQQVEACSRGKPVILQAILPFNGASVQARSQNEVSPIVANLFSSCASTTSILTITRDFLVAGDPVFGIVDSSNKAKGSAAV